MTGAASASRSSIRMPITVSPGGRLRAAFAWLVAVTLWSSVTVSGCVGCPTAGIEGVLESRGDRLGMGSGDAWSPVRVREGLFAYGIRRDPDGLVITDFVGNVIAREGDRIRAGGGGDGVLYLCSDIRVVGAG
jgi:hypothetical protein